MTTYLIEPIEKVIVYEINHIKISINNLELNTKAIVVVNFYDRQSVLRDQQTLVMEGEDYQNWTTDTYVFNWVCQQLGLQPLPSTF